MKLDLGNKVYLDKISFSLQDSLWGSFRVNLWVSLGGSLKASLWDSLGVSLRMNNPPLPHTTPYQGVTMDTIHTTLEKVASSARIHKNPKPRVITKEGTWPIGKVIRHGDVMLKRHPLGTVFSDLIPIDNYQLAPGATPGSRHVLRKHPSLRIFQRLGADVLHGPIAEAPEGFELDHPTHAQFQCRLPSTYEVLYQRDLAAEGLARRRD